MNNEPAEKPDHFLHRHVWVIEERPVLVKREFVDKTLSRHDGLLSNARNSVHLNRQFEAVPMDSGRFRQVIVEDDSHTISFICLNRRTRCAAVETPEIEGSPHRAWNDDLLHWLGDKIEHLDTVV